MTGEVEIDRDGYERIALEIKDVEGTPYTYALRIHITYRFLKFTDLEWIYEIIRRTRRKIIEEEEYTGKISKKARSQMRALVTDVSTGKSIEIELMLVSISTAIDLVSFGFLIKNLFYDVREQTRRGYFIARRGMYRENLDEVTWQLIRRTTEKLYDANGNLRKEKVDEFLMNRDRKRWDLFGSSYYGGERK
jgi:hypothetical protein